MRCWALLLVLIAMSNALFREISERVRDKISGLRVLALVRVDGSIVDQFAVDPSVDAEALAEYATLLGIADHTTEDTGTGELSETACVADRTLILTRHISPDNSLILFEDPDTQTGQARYALRQAAWRLCPAVEEAER